MKCRKCRHQNEVEICEGCYDNDAYEGYTNADRIRAMSDEELAELLVEHHRHPCKFCIDCWTESGGGCRDELMRWLKSEVKE